MAGATVILGTLAISTILSDAQLFYGCLSEASLCEKGEECVWDGLFGQCRSTPLDTVNVDIDGEAMQMLNDQLRELAVNGYGWRSPEAQCTVAYVMFTLRYDLAYDPTYCQADHPENIWAMIHGIQGHLPHNNALINSPIISKKAFEDNSDEYKLNKNEEQILNELMTRQMEGENLSDELDQLSDEQLDKFIAYTETMKTILTDRDELPLNDQATEGSLNKRLESVPEDETRDERPTLLAKKDLEKLGNTEMGLDHTEHKIVKGDAPRHRIDGDRVYMRTDKNFEMPSNEEDLRMLMAFLETTIARPKNVTFTDYSVDGHDVSFRVSPLHGPVGMSAIGASLEENNFHLSSDIAGSVFKRAEDIQQVSGANVFETAVGDAQEHIHIAPFSDALMMPVMVVGMSCVAVFMIIGAAFGYRNRSKARDLVKRLAHDIEAKPAKTYEELCRQRMGSRSDGTARTDSSTNRHSSSGAEDGLQSTSMDIATGHMILAYMEEHLSNKDKLSEDWAQLSAFMPDRIQTAVARLNEQLNRDMHVLPYDHNRVHLNADNDYINASPLYDVTPHDYIVTQAPLLTTTAQFWQMIWEAGSVVIVNITRMNENGDAKCERYWPNNGSEVNGVFEVHLVSEHMWCEDYVVRSFYLKNLRTLETRTVTQFHYVNWADNQVPATTSSLLEFRRKVNKSYRGKGSPIVVHCNNGGGRSGTYCLMDMVLNRITKGIKQLDVAASLEHLREQRMAVVANQTQYEFVLSCVADETHSILKSLH